MINFIYTNHGYLLRDFYQPRLNSDHLENVAHIVNENGAALKNCWGGGGGGCGWGSLPNLLPRRQPACSVQSVHDALKFQSVVEPNGLMGNLYGPVGKLDHVYCR